MMDNPFLDDGPFPDDGSDGAGRLADVRGIAAILQQAAREGRAMSYSEILMTLGFRFTRPRMRALCKTLDAVDTQAGQRGEPALACLVVRESDRLPGQGWWVGGTALLLGYDGPWEGAAAARFIREQQQAVFDFWEGR